jgi:Putative zinc-finger
MSGQEKNGRIGCPDFEVLLSDYLDGLLRGEDRQPFEAHAAECSPCRELMADARSAMEFLERVPEVEVPPNLITRIVYQAPEGKLRHPFERRSLFGAAFSQWLMPVLQPRFAMGMAMTILSFAMLGRCTGVHISQIKAADLNPMKVWQNTEDRVIRTKDRAVKSYENLRLVYEIRSRINELEEQRSQAQSLAQPNEAPADTQNKQSGQPAPAATPDKTGGNKQ